MRFLSLLLLGLCSRHWFVCGVVLVPYVDVCTLVSLGCVYDERVTVTTMLVWGLGEVWLG